ncbi:MAG: hypothetical protein GY845_04395 [Planctomycetes bacterium]|nr:hypothetical protein [Planctomycetota bacterium]
MSDVPSKDSVFLAFLNEFQSYLKSEKEIGKSETNERNETFVPVKITISNTAPNDIQKPLLVYTGVTVHMTQADGGKPDPMWAHTGGTKKRYKLELKSVECAWFPKVRSKALADFPSFPNVTQDEQRQGHVLFPGDSLTYEFMVPVGDINSYRFHVEGNISRRHLFHFKKVFE